MEKGQFHYVFIKGFNMFMYKQTLHHDGKRFCSFCLQSLTTSQY